MSQKLDKEIKALSNKKEVLQWLIEQDIDYGILTNDNKTIKEPSEKDYYKKMVLQSPEDVYKNSIGVCWDLCELQRYIFDKLAIEHTVMFCGIFVNSKDYNTHTYSVLVEKGKYYWFEYSWYDFRGIKGPFKSLSEVNLHVVNEMIKTHKIFSAIHLGEVFIPEYGIDYKAYLSHVAVNLIAYKRMEDI